MSKPSLLVLAAGMGSRFGGLKQIEPVGPSGETIIDYSVYDAIRSDFGKLVFVIRRDIEDAFKDSIGRRFEEHIAVEYAFQELDHLPEGYSVPDNRKKPWGTGHAVLVAREQIDEPFAVINGDDYYGAASFNVLADYLREISAKPADAKPEEYAMVGFQLRQTLSEFGHVSRGVCTLGPQDYLENIEEVTQIQPDGQGGAEYPDADGSMQKLTGDEVVSMNLWGFPPSIFDHLDKGFQSFMADHGTEEKSEFYLPAAVNHLVDLGQARVKVLKTPDSWFGVTYREDKEFVDKNIRQRIDSGLYPEKLW